MAKLKPAVLLLDLALPRFGGVGGVAAIQQLSPPTKIVLLTSTPHYREGISALKAGVRAYCNTDIDPSLLKNAAEIVQIGEIWAGRNLISHLLKQVTSLSDRRQKEPTAESNSPVNSLTLREHEIAHLIRCGASNKEIADQLNITERTVKAHLTAIFQKLRLSNRLQLAIFMTEHDLVPR